MAVFVVHRRKLQTERPFLSLPPFPAVGRILRKQANMLAGEWKLKQRQGRVAERWLEPGSGAGRGSVVSGCSAACWAGDLQNCGSLCSCSVLAPL